jgi:hypothetical protein
VTHGLQGYTRTDIHGCAVDFVDELSQVYPVSSLSACATDTACGAGSGYTVRTTVWEQGECALDALCERVHACVRCALADTLTEYALLNTWPYVTSDGGMSHANIPNACSYRRICTR